MIFALRQEKATKPASLSQRRTQIAQQDVQGREVTGTSQALHNEEFRNLSSLKDTINLTVLGVMRWVGCAARMRRIHNFSR